MDIEKFDIRNYKYHLMTLGIILLFVLVIANAYKYLPNEEVKTIKPVIQQEEIVTEDSELVSVEDEEDVDEEVEEIADTEAAEENTDSETDDDEDADVMISDENMNNSEGSTEMFFSFRPLMRYYQNNDGSNAAAEDSEADEAQAEIAGETAEDEAVTEEIVADEAVQEAEETAEETASEEEIQEEAEEAVSEEDTQAETEDTAADEGEAQEASEEADDCIDYHKKQLCDSYKELYDRLLECLNNGIFTVNEGLSEYVADDIFCLFQP